ncbi:MAG: hypothetical protein AB1591_02450 [Pseudomonadota bacterium]
MMFAHAYSMSIVRLSLYGMGLTMAAFVFILANGIPGGAIFWNLLWADIPAALLMLVFLLFAHWYGEQVEDDANRVERMLRLLDDRRYVVAFVLWVILCACALWVYRNHPLSMDEYAAVFQARIFAAGALHGQLPPDLLDYLIPPLFQHGFLRVNPETGAVFSGYWPGFSLLLAPFVWLGIPWAGNPAIVVASLLLIARIARDLAVSPQAAGWAMLFALASPAFVANGISYYSMPAHLLFNLVFVWLLLKPSPVRLVLAGLAGGFSLALHQPFPHAVFALPWIVWLAAQRGRVRNLSLLASGYLPVFLLLVVGWLLWRQDILRVGVHAAVAADMGSGMTLIDRAMGMLRGFLGLLHWPNEPIIYARLAGLAKLWLWASPLLLLLAWWGARGEKRPGIRLLGASALLTFFAYFLIEFDQGHGWGYRYFHSAWGVLPVLAALGVIKLSGEGPRVFRQVALLAMLSLLALNALRLVQMGEFMQAHLAQSPPRVEASGRKIYMHYGRGYYALDLIQNDPWMRGDEVVLLVRNKADVQRVLEYFPGARQVADNQYGITAVQTDPGWMSRDDRPD